MNRKYILLILSAMVVGAAFGAGYARFFGPIVPEQTAASTESAASLETTLIRPADTAVDQVTAPAISSSWTQSRW